MMSTQEQAGKAYPLPRKLTLIFSQAADGARVDKMFDPSLKSQVDPNAYVVRREKSSMDHHVANGHAAMLVDEKGDAQTLTIAWHAVDAKGKHRYTEVGTSLARLSGFHSAQPLVAALVLKEWWAHKPEKGIVAEIVKANVPSGRLYRDTLGWRDIADMRVKKDIEKHCNANVLEDVNASEPYDWLRCGRDAVQAQARVLLDFIDRGHLRNKQGAQITLDLSTLDAVGLTRKRLEAMAAGNIHRGRLALL